MGATDGGGVGDIAGVLSATGVRARLGRGARSAPGAAAAATPSGAPGAGPSLLRRARGRGHPRAAAGRTPARRAGLWAAAWRGGSAGARERGWRARGGGTGIAGCVLRRRGRHAHRDRLLDGRRRHLHGRGKLHAKGRAPRRDSAAGTDGRGRRRSGRSQEPAASRPSRGRGARLGRSGGRRLRLRRWSPTGPAPSRGVLDRAAPS